MTLVNEFTQPLLDLQPSSAFFVGIDSDGCVFDSMEIKHKECFIPNIIKHWSLQAVSKYAREAAEFVNLYSQWRGANRWPALVKAIDLLGEREEVQRRKSPLPDMPNVRVFVSQTQFPHSNEGLALFMAAHPGKEDLETAWAWTHAVNATVEDIVKGVPPFPFVRESLSLLQGKADMIVVSATPVPALTREWQEHDLDGFVRVIAGQEMGKKAEHLAMAAGNKYAKNHVLMIGDALGDLNAAKANGALFYPINPGEEEASWQRFYEEAAQKFLDEEFAGAYEAGLIAEFERYLPESPPWKTNHR